MEYKNLRIENARMIFRNFRGEASLYNNAGNRNFCLLLNPEFAANLESEGWNVKWPKKVSPDDDRDPYIPVAVKFGINESLDPKVYVRNSVKDKFIQYTEGMVGNLDNAEIESCDLVIRPRQWEMNGKSGVKAYLKSMYVTLMQDEFYGKYFSSEPADYEAPFEMADAQY